MRMALRCFVLNKTRCRAFCTSPRLARKTWGKLKNKKWGTEYALENFDEFYGPVFGKKWPSIRLALLCQQKYCAVINNYSEMEKAMTALHDVGARDIRPLHMSRLKYLLKSVNAIGEDTDVREVKDDTDLHENNLDEIGSNRELDEIDEDFSSRIIGSGGSLSEFVPATKLRGMEDWVDDSDYFATYRSDRKFNFTLKTDLSAPLPQQWKIFCFKRGDISMFPEPGRGVTGLLDYYLMDASSLLPVLALNPEPEDNILDMCAAPGGKTLAILQTLNEVNLTCNDEQLSRVKRLRNVLRTYVPSSVDHPQLIHDDGRKVAARSSHYNKILVDVPCTNDRLSANENDNNLFNPMRVKDRVRIPEVQTDLLQNALQCVQPGGTVVYSTCSLSPIQNDGVVHMALHHVWETTSSKFVIHDLTQLFWPLRFLFAFHPSPKYGQLVIPSVVSNFGPMYICKMTKVEE